MAAPRQPIEELSRSASTPIVLAICGDPVVGRALVLLLRSSLYDTKFISISFLSDAGALEGVRLVLLTPMWEFYGGDHEALSAPLRAASGVEEVPILELISSSGGARNGEALAAPEHTVPWPCSTEELERRIEAALLACSHGLSRPAASGT